MFCRYKRRRYITYLWIAIFTVIFGSLALYADNCVRPMVQDVAINQAQTESERIINEAVLDVLDEEKIQFDSIIAIKYDDSKTVSSLNIDTVYLNKLKSKIIQRINNNISEFDDGEISIKIGSFFENEFLNGRGPRIKFNYEMSNNVTIKYSDKFLTAGINQTKHRLMLDIMTELYIITPLLDTTTSFETEILINETLIVGKVPDGVTNLDIN